jgi:hypothetical protein
MEGWNVKGSRARRNNNPGNLRSWKGVPVDGGYAKFPTAAEGWNALRSQIKRNVGRSLTFIEFFGGKKGVYPGYAPGADGNAPRHYAEFVAKRVGVPADVPLITLIDKESV